MIRNSGVRRDDYHQLLFQRYARRLNRRLQGQDRMTVRDADPYAWISERNRPYLLAAVQRARTAADWAEDQRLVAEVTGGYTWMYEVTGTLYEFLFSRAPHLRSLFPGALTVQRERLARALLFLVEDFGRMENITVLLRQLGEEHRKLGIRPVHFESFGDALIDALSLHAGARWTGEAEAAWRRMYWFGASAIIEGIEVATVEPPFWNATVTRHELRRADTAVLHVRPDHPYPFEAGRHATIESPLLPHAWRRYSMAAPPRPDGILEFHVRAVGSRGVSAALVHHTAVGDELRLGPPRGRLAVDDESTRDVLLIAGGTGLAAARALFIHLARRTGDNRNVWLLLGVGRDDDGRDLADLEAVRASGWRPERLMITPVAGVGDDDAWFVEEAAARDGNWANHDVYVSGSSEMTHRTLHFLRQLGVPAEQIRHDRD